MKAQQSTTKPSALILIGIAFTLTLVFPQLTHGIYCPKHGRWLQRDPLGVRPVVTGGSIDTQRQYSDGMNLYEYVRSHPTDKLDPHGTKSSQECVDDYLEDVMNGMDLISAHKKYIACLRLARDPKVEVCCRNTQLSCCLDAAFAILKVRHCWIRTSSVEAGMGPRGGGTIEEGPPPCCGTEITDHKGEGNLKITKCIKLSGCDEDCVNQQLVVGQPISGTWPDYNCNTLVKDILRNCGCKNKCLKWTTLCEDPNNPMTCAEFCTKWEYDESFPIPKW